MFHNNPLSTAGTPGGWMGPSIEALQQPFGEGFVGPWLFFVVHAGALFFDEGVAPDKRFLPVGVFFCRSIRTTYEFSSLLTKASATPRTCSNPFKSSLRLQIAAMDVLTKFHSSPPIVDEWSRDSHKSLLSGATPSSKNGAPASTRKKVVARRSLPWKAIGGLRSMVSSNPPAFRLCSMDCYGTSISDNFLFVGTF